MFPFAAASQTRPRNYESMRSNTVYNPAPYEVLGANMPETSGILPLTIRVGNPITTYKLNKIESVRPNSDYVYFHLEKYCGLDGLWYPQWLQLSIYCEMFREILLAVFKASLERPERTHFLLTLARYLSLKDDAPQASSNPMSTRYHWRGPMHTTIWAELQREEVPGAEQYQVYPQPPRRPRVDVSQFQRAMLAHITSSAATSTITTPSASTFTASTRPRNREFDSDDVSQTETEITVNVDSDADSVDTTAAVVFTPAAKLLKRLTENRDGTDDAGPSTSRN